MVPPDGTSRAELAYSKLRAEIHSGRYGAGQRMREADLAERLGISRTPVRDALKRLESDGLLTAAPRRGLAVAALDQQQVSEIYAVRDVLEGLAGQLAAQHASTAEILALRDLIERQRRTRTGDVAALARLNRQFHEVTYRAARNRYLMEVLGSFESSLALLPGTTYVAPGRAENALRQHVAIVDAIEKRDAERAQALARQHVRDAERIRLLMISGADLELRGAKRLKPAARGRRP